jgi:hypothetical protein
MRAVEAHVFLLASSIILLFPPFGSIGISIVDARIDLIHAIISPFNNRAAFCVGRLEVTNLIRRGLQMGINNFL